MKGFFVTGTDTGIGKTVLSALLVAALDAFYWKPIQTGVSEGTDRETVRRLAEPPEERLLPESYCFVPPVSPHLAARLAGTRINLDALTFPAVHPVQKDRSWIVEGAGGAMTPINETALMLDLMLHVKLPVVVATRTSLGTINHTLMTLFALREAKLTVRGVVMIGANNDENRSAIENYGNVQVIGQIPVLERLNRASLLEVFDQQFDRQKFQTDSDDLSNDISKATR